MAAISECLSLRGGISRIELRIGGRCPDFLILPDLVPSSHTPCLSSSSTIVRTLTFRWVVVVGVLARRPCLEKDFQKRSSEIRVVKVLGGI